MKKLIRLGVAVCSTVMVMNLMSVSANAEWRQDSKGWSYTYYGSNETYKNSKLNINGKYYYFDEQGYMKTGWCQNSQGEWYYAYSDGSLASNTTINGYTLSKGCTMISDEIKNEMDYYRKIMYKHVDLNPNELEEYDYHDLKDATYFNILFKNCFVFRMHKINTYEYFNIVIDKDTEKVYQGDNKSYYTEWNNKHSNTKWIGENIKK